MDTEIVATDYHTAGEPFRIVPSGIAAIPGVSVADRRQHAIGDEGIQRIRELLCHEPRGHADMYGCFLVPPDDDGADLGVLFWHTDGFSTACGHGTIALATWAVDTGVVRAEADGSTDVRIDVPSGRVLARVNCAAGRVVDVVFRNVPSYVLHRGVTVSLAGRDMLVDISFGGAIYASIPASAVGLAVVPDSIGDLTAVGREIKWAVESSGFAEHPADPRLSGCYGTMLYDDLGDGADGPGGEGPGGEGPGGGPYQRGITVFADGEVDRSPCGSGTSARMALLHADGRLPPGATFTHESIIGTRFTAQVTGEVRAAGRPAVITEIRGSAYRTGEHRFVLDPRDALGTGFVLR